MHLQTPIPTDFYLVGPSARLEGRKFRTGSDIAGAVFEFDRRLLAVIMRPLTPMDPTHYMLYGGVPPSLWRAMPTGLTAYGFYRAKIQSVYLYLGSGRIEDLGLDKEAADWLPNLRKQAMVSAIVAARAADEEAWREAAAFGKKKTPAQKKESHATALDPSEADE